MDNRTRTKKRSPKLKINHSEPVNKTLEETRLYLVIRDNIPISESKAATHKISLKFETGRACRVRNSKADIRNLVGSGR